MLESRLAEILDTPDQLIGSPCHEPLPQKLDRDGSDRTLEIGTVVAPRNELGDPAEILPSGCRNPACCHVWSGASNARNRTAG